MAGDKTAHSFELLDDQAEFLVAMAATYDLADPGKALRCLIDYAKEEGVLDDIFGTVRCLRCG